MLPQVQVLGGVYPGDCGHENPGAGSVRLDHLKTVVLILQTRVSEVRSPWKVWTCDPKYTIWGRLSPWRLWTSGHQVQGLAGGCHNGDCGHMTPGAGSGRGVNLDTVDL